MPIFDFICSRDHSQTLMLTFDEHESLARDPENNKKYIDCNIKYGDLKQPVCPEKAYQQFGKIGFVGLKTAPP